MEGQRVDSCFKILQSLAAVAAALASAPPFAFAATAMRLSVKQEKGEFACQVDSMYYYSLHWNVFLQNSLEDKKKREM